MELTFNERRVLGVLIEKGFTTPEQYPLTLNAVVVGANQKSCRQPVVQIGEEAALEALDRLRRKGLCSLVQPAGGRTNRWRHLAIDALHIEGIESAIVAELLLRGPQTDGELRQNVGRMADLESLEALQQAVDRLRGRPEPLVVRLGPESRRRGVRFAHTFYPAAELEAIKKRELAELAEMPEPPAGPAGPAADPAPAGEPSRHSAETIGGSPADRASRPSTADGQREQIEQLLERMAESEKRLDRLEKELGLA